MYYYYKNQKKERKRNSLIFPFILITSCLILSYKVESRALDGSDNNMNNPTFGTPNQSFQRKYPGDPFFRCLSSSSSSLLLNNHLNDQLINCLVVYFCNKYQARWWFDDKNSFWYRRHRPNKSNT